MKKIFLAMCALCLALNGAKAQKVIADNVEGAPASTTASSSSTTSDDDVLMSGMGIEYQGFDGGWGLGYNLIYNHFMLGWAMQNGETNDYVKSNSGWGISLGYNYRHWLGKSFYIEGTAGVFYRHWTIETKEFVGTETKKVGTTGRTITVNKYENNKDSDGKFGLFINPRIGVALGKSFSIFAGYRWDFVDFKFDKDNTSDYFTVGAAWLF